MPALSKNAILLAIDPTSRGFAFAVLEAPAFLLDWGSKSATMGSGSLVRKVDELLSRHQPDVLMLEDLAAKGAQRRIRAREEIQAIERLALTRGVPVERVSRLGVLDTFAPRKTKYEVALRLAEIFPVLANRLPRKRKTWTPEETRMSVFDALAIAAALLGEEVRRSAGGLGSRQLWLCREERSGQPSPPTGGSTRSPGRSAAGSRSLKTPFLRPANPGRLRKSA